LRFLTELGNVLSPQWANGLFSFRSVETLAEIWDPGKNWEGSLDGLIGLAAKNVGGYLLWQREK